MPTLLSVTQKGGVYVFKCTMNEFNVKENNKEDFEKRLKAILSDILEKMVIGKELRVYLESEWETILRYSVTEKEITIKEITDEEDDPSDEKTKVTKTSMFDSTDALIIGSCAVLGILIGVTLCIFCPAAIAPAILALEYWAAISACGTIGCAGGMALGALVSKGPEIYRWVIGYRATSKTRCRISVKKVPANASSKKHTFYETDSCDRVG